jgi:hypothetical protein
MKRLKQLCIALLKLALLIFALPGLMTFIIVYSMPDLGALAVFKWMLILECIGFILMPWWGALIISLIVVDIFLWD